MTDTNVPTNHPINSQDDEINLLELWNILWDGKWIITKIILGFAITSLSYSLLLPNIFRAEALLSPSGEQGGTQISGQLGFAANLAGVNLAQTSNKTVNALATLQSRGFAKKFIADHDLLPWLFASQYSASERASMIDVDLYDSETRTWLRDQSPLMPTEGEAYKLFSAILSVAENQETGLVSIAIEWPDPTLAARWVNWLVSDINAHIKTGDKQEAQRAIEYLKGQLVSTQLVEMQRVFYQLIESQTRTLMLADIREGYVFETIDPAVVPEKKNEPRRSLICILGTLMGGIIAVLYVLMSHYVSLNQRKGLS